MGKSSMQTSYFLEACLIIDSCVSLYAGTSPCSVLTSSSVLQRTETLLNHSPGSLNRSTPVHLSILIQTYISWGFTKLRFSHMFTIPVRLGRSWGATISSMWCVTSPHSSPDAHPSEWRMAAASRSLIRERRKAALCSVDWAGAHGDG